MLPYVDVLVPLNFSFVEGGKYTSSCILLHVAIYFEKHHLLKMVCFIQFVLLTS